MQYFWKVPIFFLFNVLVFTRVNINVWKLHLYQILHSLMPESRDITKEKNKSSGVQFSYHETFIIYPLAHIVGRNIGTISLKKCCEKDFHDFV